ncbi:S4 domain-containing protein [Candidatus Vidania fulgoroideorum]
MRKLKRIKKIKKFGYINGYFSKHKSNIKFKNDKLKSDLFQKQKIKLEYLLKEKQYKKYLIISKFKKIPIIKIIERRFDNIIYISGFAKTKFESRQIINHKYFLINKKDNNIPSTLIKKGDKISLKKKFYLYKRIKINSVLEKNRKWLNIDKKKLTIKIVK